MNIQSYTGKTALFSFCVFIALCLATLPAQADFQKTKIAVLDFELIGDKLETAEMGAILSEWLTTSIVKTGRFDVVERAMLQKILVEQKLSKTGIIDEKSASELGKILGVKVIISGSVVKLFDILEINARVISVESGSIIAAESIRSNTGGRNLHALVEQLTVKIMRNFPLTGYIVKKSADSVIIDLGLGSGVAQGTEFIVYKEGAIIKHPKTGEVLDVEQVLTGRIKIAKVSKNVAEGTIIREEPGGIIYGHLVKSVQKSKTGRVASAQPAKTPAVTQKPTQVVTPVPAPVVAPPKAIVRIKTEREKSVLKVPSSSQEASLEQQPAPPVVLEQQPAPPIVVQQPKVKKTPDVYKVAIFPWVLHREAGGFKTVLVDRIQYRINNMPRLTLATSYYKLKKVPQFSMYDRPSALFHGVSPNIGLLQQKGTELGIDVAILGQMNIYCRWSDNCQVRSMDFHIVDLTTGRVYTESGSAWDSGARTYIDTTAKKAFKKFEANMK